jgi:hypothetical protein
MTTAPGGGRSAWKLLIVLGAIVAGVGGFFVITTRSVLDPDRFGANVAASLGEDRVAEYVANQLTDAIISQRPNLLAVRPVLLSSVQSIVRSTPFRAIVARSARTTHRFFFEQAGSRIVLSLPDVGAVIRGALSQASPELAAKIPPGLEAKLATGKAEKAITGFIRLWQFGDRLLVLSWVLVYGGLLMIVGGIALAPDRQHALAHAGIALVVVAVAYLAVVPASRLVIYAALQDNQLAGFVHGVVKFFLWRLQPGALLVGVPGLLFMAAGTATLDRFDPATVARRGMTLLITPPQRPGQKVLWAFALLLLGTVALLWPVELLRGVMLLVALGLMQLALRELFLMIRGSAAELRPGGARVSARGWLAIAIPAVVILGIGGLGARLLARGGEIDPVASGVPSTCNGSARLCDRSVDKVVFAGAHNSMSNASISGWMFPHHPYAIARMLDDGVRMLALDLHLGIPTGGRVKTDIDNEVGGRGKIEEALGPEGVAAAMRIRNRLVGGEDGQQGVYFCHGFCELGAYEAAPTLVQIREFLAANPGEVLILVLEDYLPVNMTDSLFKATGLFDYVYTGSVRAWPTLGQLVASNQRLIVFIESGQSGVGWLHGTVGEIQETPYSFHKLEDFSCRPNRGGTQGSLFLINHWIETTPAPRASNAEIVNAYDFLLRRARACQRERRHIPNIISVDFYSVGDLVRVANTLNGIDSTVVLSAGGR